MSRFRLFAGRTWWRLDAGGLALGLVLAALSLTPSLLPRPALLQGVIAGLSFAVGYAVGALLVALLRPLARRLIGWRPSAAVIRWTWIAGAVVVLAAGAWFAVLAVAWQNEVRALVEMPPVDGVDIAAFYLGALPVAVLCLAIGRGIRRLHRGLSRLVGPLIGALGAALLVGLGAFTLGTVVMGAIDGIYEARNAAPAHWVSEPTSEFHSAGADSPMEWETLGRHGTAFLGGGPTADDIAEVTGESALEPIRVYSSLHTADSTAGRAALAVDELVRTGAFERSVLVVATATGSGWLEPQTTDSLEYLHGGDTAIVSMQYAYTPSWVSFVFEPDAPVDAARVLFDAVHAEWLTHPASERPKLISYGLSLGAHGSQSTFADLAEVRERTDGALFVGSPNGTPLWRELQAARESGSPAWQPVLDAGAEVRWMSQPGDFDKLAGPWGEPHVAYLQHATDPVTWLGPELLWAEPDWLLPGQRAADVSPNMHWIPVVTALQVVVDMLMGESVPASHGHNYGDVVLDGWAAVTGDGGLDAAAIERIRAVIAEYAAVRPVGSSVGE
ncbi:alpha/beta hydrolase [Microterricola pindariensis]|uniref:alpha/beta hydrolase n=1 Tax=Microterricola pindariensis TaxID=478010 RepID=UPI000CEC48E1|nr:alpha/beta-hydrolase family protein [Microterricola pindariensis]